NTGNGDNGKVFKNLSGKEGCFPLMAYPGEPSEYHAHRQYTAYSLTEKGGPGDACDAHVEGGHKPDIHPDVRKGGYGQEEGRCPGIAQGRENSRGDIVKEHKGKPPDIDIQVKLGIVQNLGGRVDPFQQKTASKKPH